MVSPLQTRREYLAGLNPPLAKANSRGRLSKEAHDAINDAVANGVKFKDMPGVAVEGTTPVKSESVSKNTEDFTGPTAPKRFNGGWYVIDDGKRLPVSGNEVCRTCTYSLDWHFCDSPVGIDRVGNLVPVMR